jgi:hypothetical protein
MIRLIAVAALALAIATSAQAITLAPLHQSDGLITQIRQACGPGQVRIKGVCVLRTTTRQVRRAHRKCAAYSEGFCVQYY